MKRSPALLGLVLVAAACSGGGSNPVAIDAADDGDAQVAIDAPSDAPAIGNLTVVRGGTGMGTVISAPVGIDCGADCTESFAQGTSVTLTAAAAPGSIFAGWMTDGPANGNCADAGPCTVQVGAATTVRARFELSSTDMCVLGVEIQGPGTGQVFSSPLGIGCAPDCRETYACGTLVTLSATTTSVGGFVGWGGACANASPSCVVVVDQPFVAVIARFQ